jgi:O-antigen biosynthesis protein
MTVAFPARSLLGRLLRRVRRSLQPEIPFLGCVDYACWLSDTVLLVAGWFPTTGGVDEVLLVSSGRWDQVEARHHSYARPDVPGNNSTIGKLLTIVVPDRLAGRKTLSGVRLVVRSGTSRFQVGGTPLGEQLVDLDTLIGGAFTRLDSETRLAIASFLAETGASHATIPGSTHPHLARSVARARTVLLEPTLARAVTRDHTAGLAVDTLAHVGECLYYAQGWMVDRDSTIAGLAAISPDGRRVELLDSVFRFERADVAAYYGLPSTHEKLARAGFICHFRLEGPATPSSGWQFELRNTADESLVSAAPTILTDPIEARNAIIEGLPIEALPSEPLMRDHVHPAIEALQARCAALVEIEDVAVFGQPKVSAEVSVIVPLYRRIDFLEHQLAQFVHDPEMLDVDLIYVLDSPELKNALRDAAAQLYALYRIPFRTVILRRNVGFSGANNAGASVAVGRRLILLNSDVLPDQPGWVGRLLAFHQSLPQVGALGPKLLYEDGSLQHAGMYFHRPAGTALSGLWQNLHYYKGFHGDLPDANVARPVPAVTGACIMIEKSLYHEVGGLQSVYVQGDHEDSDLCLRLIAAGRQNWYLPSVQLYHLEGQSYPGPLRARAALYNRWLHTRLWDSQIEHVMSVFPSPFRTPGVRSPASSLSPAGGRGTLTNGSLAEGHVAPIH